MRLREHARAAGRPVVMATSHRGMLDVERFDLEPRAAAVPRAARRRHARPSSRGLTTKQKVPYVIRILDPASLTDRAAASMVEVKETRLDVAAARLRRRARRRDGGQRRAADRARRAHRAPGASTPTSTTLTADGRQAPLAPAPAAAAAAGAGGAAADAAAGRRGAADARGDPLHRRLRELGAVRRQHAAVALRGGRRRHPRVGRPGAVVAAGLPRPRRAARARRRAGGGARSARARSASSPCARPVAADGPVWELALERVDARPRRGGGRGPVAALLQPAHRRVAADRGGRARAARAPRRAARHARPGRRRARGARRRPGRARPRALPLAAAAPRPDGRAALHAPRRRTPRATASTSPRSSSTAPTSRRWTSCAPAPAWTSSPRLDRGWGLGNAARDAFAGSAGAIVLRAAAVDRAALARRRPRAHAAVARGDAPRAGRPSVGLAVPLPAPARGRATRWRAGSAAR